MSTSLTVGWVQSSKTGMLTTREQNICCKPALIPLFGPCVHFRKPVGPSLIPMFWFFFLCAWLGCFIPELGTLCGFSVWMHTLDYGFFGIFGLLLCSTSSSSERAAPCHTPTLAFHTAPYLPSPPSLLRFHFIYLLFVPVSSSSAECIVRLQIP